MEKTIKYIKIKWYKHPIQRYKQWHAERELKKHIADGIIYFLTAAGKDCEK